MATRHRAFGVDIDAAFPLPELPPAPVRRDEAAVLVRLASAAEIEAAWTGAANPPRVRDTVIDSTAYRAEAGAGEDVLMTWGDARFHLSPDAAVLLCAPPDEAAPGWRRLLLDTVLATVSMRRGSELIHAGGVVTEHGLLAVIAGTGGGKSTLVAELLARGARLFCDDLLTVRPGAERPLCEPGPPLMNLALDGPEPRALARRELARFPDEAWVAVERYSVEPAPVSGFVLLDRTPETKAAELLALDMPHLVLMAAALDTGRSAERRELRFRLMSDLAANTQGVRLRAPLDAAPAELAALAEQAAVQPTVGARR